MRNKPIKKPDRFPNRDIWGIKYEQRCKREERWENIVLYVLLTMFIVYVGAVIYLALKAAN